MHPSPHPESGIKEKFPTAEIHRAISRRSRTGTRDRGSANADVRVLVTNFGQGGTTYNLVGVRESAQSFTTGGNAGGYDLEGIDIRVYTFSGDEQDITLSLLSSNSGEPGAELFNLDHDATQDLGFQQKTLKFIVPADVGSSLDPGTKYFVFVHYADPIDFLNGKLLMTMKIPARPQGGVSAIPATGALPVQTMLGANIPTAARLESKFTANQYLPYGRRQDSVHKRRHSIYL